MSLKIPKTKTPHLECRWLYWDEAQELARHFGLTMKKLETGRTDSDLFVWFVWEFHEEQDNATRRIEIRFPIWENSRWKKTIILFTTFQFINPQLIINNLYQYDSNYPDKRWVAGVGLTKKDQLPEPLRNFLSEVGL